MPKNLKSVIITVTDNKLKDIQKVADQLADTGLKVNRVLPITGVISGSCAPNKVSDLEKINGVLSVEEETVADLPPADSYLQ